MKHCVLNIPHASTNGLFDANFSGWNPTPHFINSCVNRFTDWYTDYLFATDSSLVSPVVFPYSRFVCDAERLWNDPKEQEGQGIVYKHFADHVRENLTPEIEQHAFALWNDHQNNLKNAMHENCVLIDCHSFPSDMSKYDICIGFNNDWSYDEGLVAIVKSTFEINGFSVGFNTPFSHSITPKTDFMYKSLMIEVNKQVYMDEQTLMLKTDGDLWTRWFRCMDTIYKKIECACSDNKMDAFLARIL